MPGSLFAVILTSKQQEGVRRLQDAYPSSKIYTELGGNIVIVADETLTSTIAEKGDYILK